MPKGRRDYALVTLGTELVERTTSLEQRLINTSTTRNDTHSRTSSARHGLLRSGRKTNTGLVVVGVVADNGSVVAGGTGERTAVADLLLDVADDGTFGALADREDVADGERGLLAAVDEGAGVQAFGGDEGLLAELVPVGVTEDHAGEGGTTVFVFEGVDEVIRMDIWVVGRGEGGKSGCVRDGWVGFGCLEYGLTVRGRG